jgi:hypothetical protein
MPQYSKILEGIGKSAILRRLYSKSHSHYLPRTHEQKNVFLSLSESEFVGRCARYLLGNVPENESFQRLQEHLEALADRTLFFKSLFYSEESFAFRNHSKLSLPSEASYPFEQNSSTAKKILVVSNCQTLGLANCLSLHCANVRVEACDMWTFQKQSNYWLGRIKEFDQIFGSQGPELNSVIDFTKQPKTLLIPGFHMECYHKDLTYCWLGDGETRVKTPLDDYHSRICLTAYRLGASVEKTVAMFHAGTYRALGYLSDWERDRESFIAMYGMYGLEVRDLFLEWARKGLIPHSVNHPTIAMLSDLARLMARKVGLPLVDHNLLPHDNLANGPIFPVYPEMAMELGLACGSYRFKTVNRYHTVDLVEFVRRCFEEYGKYDGQALQFVELNANLGGFLLKSV